MKVPFNLKNAQKNKTSIEAVVRFSGLRFKIATGQSVNPAYWLPESHRANYTKPYPEAKEINEKLEKLENQISAAVEYFTENSIKPDADEFRKRVFSASKPVHSDMKFTDYMQTYIDNSTLSKQTLKNYKVALKKIIKFQQDKKIVLRFSNIDIHFYRSFEKWIFSQINEKTGNPYSINFFGGLIKIIKKMMNLAVSDGLTNAAGHKHPGFKKLNETADTVYLSVEELYKIHNLEITTTNLKLAYPKLTEKLLTLKMKSYILVKDLFLIGAFTALRVGDFKKLEDINFENGFLKVKTTKTAVPVVVPVHPVVKEIISKDNFSFSNRISEQKINKQIKKICQLAGIDNKVEISRTHANKQFKTVAEKWELITTHTARRSAATNMFRAGIPAISIMKITGHTTERSFMKYIKVTQEQNAELLKSHPFFTQKPPLRIVS